MKYNRTPICCGLAASALLLVSASLSSAQTPITNIINTFDAAGTYGGGIGREWGPSSATWDSVAGIPAGAELVTAVWDPTSDTPLTSFACKGDGANPWYTPNPITFSLYDTLEFDIKYDNTSDITIDQFNNVSTWPLTLTNSVSGNLSVFQSWASAGQIGAGGSIGGLEIDLCGGPGGQMAPFIINTNIPAAAASGWTHIKIPINKAQGQIDGVAGVVFHKWCANTWTLVTNVTARFWIDNVMLIGTSAPPPPPTVSVPTKATQGLNAFASTQGNSFYDRQSVRLRNTSGLSWVGIATPANPVTYSFTIAGYPNSPDCEAYLFLVPNPNANDQAPDWNETNCAIAYIQGTANNATMRFRYKVNEDHQQAMYSGGNEGGKYYTNAPGSWNGVTTPWYESGDLGSVTNNGVLGTWKIKFTSDTNVTLIAPNGDTSSFVIPPYNVGYFAEHMNPGFNIYLGMQANQANAMNQSVVYSSFAVAGVPSAYSENFLADAVLDTTNTWDTAVSGGPKGVLIVPAGSASWIKWTLPDTGFNLEIAPALNNPLAWTQPSTGPIIPLYGFKSQLIAQNELPTGGMAFFRLVKREFAKLQVLLPGETAAPGTVTGKTGTPIPVSLAASGQVNITVNAVDANWYPVTSTDTVAITTSDGTALLLPIPMPMVGGTVTFTPDNPLIFGSTGSFTVTATDNTDGTKTANTSSVVTVVP
jgi:hypothetical protein